MRYSSAPTWLHALLRPLRVPIVFLLSGLASFCAFKDGGAVIGNGSGTGPRTERLALWDADLMPEGKRLKVREKMSAAFGQQVNPDVLVLYDVPSFAQLLTLRDALGLYGYTAVMSNFFCGHPPRGMAWPLEIAVLSRYPISDATQFNAPGQSGRACNGPAPLRNGPVVAARKTLTRSRASGHRWPMAGKHPLPGPGLLTVRIGSLGTAIVAVRVPAKGEYPGASAAALNAMRLALAARARAWMAQEAREAPDTKIFAMGDFGVADGHDGYATASLAQADDREAADALDRLMQAADPDRKAAMGRTVNLTRALFEEGLAPGVYPHSDRIYLRTSGAQSFGDAQRAENSYGSRAFPLVIRSSGASCIADPRLMRYRLSPALAGLSKQFFVVSETGLDRQLAAFTHAYGRKRGWIVSIDIDDLLIDNAPFLTAIAQQCRAVTRNDRIAWLKSGRARLMPGAGPFMRMLQARAQRQDGRILLLTARDDGLRKATMAELKRLGVFDGAKDSRMVVRHAATQAARNAIWREMTAHGGRVALVLGTRANQFPTDPALRVGGSVRSCPDTPQAHRRPVAVLGSEAAHFGHCFFLLPVHVL